MLLSVDWDAFSGPRELVFDAPIWGTADREYDRLGAWQQRASKRGGPHTAPHWKALAADFPLYGGWEHLRQYAGRPASLALSHADAWGWLQQFAVQDVLNVDAHHDLCSFSGDPARLRPGNWAGLALEQGRIGGYTCLYPQWHAELPVAEGYDLERTRAEFAPRLSAAALARVTLSRTDLCSAAAWPSPAQVTALLLVQSPAWTNPAHDSVLRGLCTHLNAATLTPLLERP